MLIISYLCSITSSFIMSLVKYCEPHVTYRQLIDLGNDVFDYDSSEVWKLKRQKDRDVVNKEFLSDEVREKWFVRTPSIRFIRGSHLIMLIALMMHSFNVSKYEDELRKKYNINNKKCVLDILFEYYGETGDDYDELSGAQILCAKIEANSRT